ncbi:hypothetical protein [Pseudoalteromonas rubra]|uniref:hypothetical protein n=1 Tax=Pseudoalteromonas rubra TaxID=43658 RepID=UPI000F76E56A|nr:hypothetical protein [Pseudoalteromonas rubra]
MKPNRFTLPLLCMLPFSGSLLASASLDELMIEGNIAVFKTHAAKSHTVPNCVAADKKAQWAIDLTTHAGRATYSSLVTAMSTGAQIEVQSARACLADSGYEKTQSVKVKAVHGSAMGGKSVRFVGFVYFGRGASAQAMDAWCANSGHAKGSRAMRWEDYKQVKPEVDAALKKYSPSQQNAWILEAMQSASTQYIPSTNTYRHSVLMKDETFINPATFPDRYPFNYYANCSSSDGYSGILKDSGRFLDMARCSSTQAHVACVI